MKVKSSLLLLIVPLAFAMLRTPAVPTPQAPTIALRYASFLGVSGVDDCDGLGLGRDGTLVLGCHSDSPDLAPL